MFNIGICVYTNTNEVIVLKQMFHFFTSLFFIGLTLYIALYLYGFFHTLSFEDERNTVTIYDVNQEVLYESNFHHVSEWTPISTIPKLLQDTVLCVEDQRFYYHPGFDPIRIGIAFVKNMTSSFKQGGSTITQQLAKNLFLTNEQTYKRKFLELFYAARLEMQYSKQEILEAYLNTLYYGHGIYGIQHAASYFFNKSLQDLSVDEIAMLVAIPNGPSLYSPYINPSSANHRQQLILHLMHQNNLISLSAYKHACNTKTAVVHHEDDQERTLANYYIDSVFDELASLNLQDQSNLRIYSHYDPYVQQQLQDSITQAISIDAPLETAAIVLSPFDFHVLAIAGGKNYTLSPFNRALYAKRQIASTIKPLLYYHALTQGFTPSTSFVSKKTTFRISDSITYSPTNYLDHYPNKAISMINAISTSDNIYAVKTHLFLNPSTLADSLSSFGFSDIEPNASLALGTIDLSLYDLSKIYGTFASEGLYKEPSFIASIKQDDRIIYEEKKSLTHKLQRDEVLILNQMLTSTYDIQNKSYTFPTMYGYAPQSTFAIKSGTSNWDSFVMGYNPEYLIGVWCGYDKQQILEKQYYVISKQIFKQCADALYENRLGPWYKPSNSLEIRLVDPITGKNDPQGMPYWYKK